MSRTPTPEAASTRRASTAAPARPSPRRAPTGRLLRELHLENFMLHADSRIPFATPIVLLTGANGSGKTQLLDALLLALGSKSTRVKKEGLAELVGPNGDSARVTLSLANPRLPVYARPLAAEGDDYDDDGPSRLGDRALATGVRELDRLTDAEVVHVVFELQRGQNSLTYRLGPPGDERRVTQGMVERLFSQAGVSPRNSLAFTEEGTISNFSSDSPHKQFEAFLETTQLAELRELLEKLHVEVGNAKSRLDPLEQQYHMQRSLLEHMRTDLDNLRRREELEQRVRTLEIEVAWCQARAAAEQAQEAHTARERMQQRLQTAQARKAKAEAELDSVRAEIERLHSTLDRLEALSRDRSRQLGQLEAALEHNEKQAEGMERGLAKHDEELAGLDKRLAEAGGDTLETRLAEVREAYEQAKAAAEALEREVAAAQRAVRRVVHAHLPGSTLTGRGLEYLAQCLRLRALAAAHGLGAPDAEPAARNLFGPLLLEWSLAPGLPAAVRELAEEALPLLLADALTTFVARDETAWQQTLALLRDAFGEPRPPLRIALAPPSAGAPSTASTASTAGDANAGVDAAAAATALYGLDELLVAPPAVLAYLQRRHPVALPRAPQNLDLAAVRHLAQQAGCRVYLPGERLLVTADDVALPDAAAGEAAQRLTGGLAELQQAAEAHTRERELQPQVAAAKQARDLAHENLHQATLAQEEVARLAKLRAEKQAARQQLHEALTAARERITKYRKDVERLKRDEQETRQRLEASQKLDAARTRRSELEVDVREQERAIAQADMRTQQLDAEVARAREAAVQQKQAASALGPQPGEERERAAVEAELNQTRGTLEGLQRITRTRTEYEAQEAQVERLHADVQNARAHLDGLEDDLKVRLREWKAELGDRLDGARTVMRHLLRDHFERVDLRAVELAKKGRGGGELATALELRCSRRNGPMLSLAGLSGGEKVLVVGALIFALHCLTDSPVHALDEFTQKLDVEFKAAAFRMAVEAVAYAREHASSAYAPQFVLLCPDTLGVELDTPDISHVVVIRAEDERGESADPRRGRSTVQV